MSSKTKDPKKIKFDIHVGIKLRNKRVERRKTQERLGRVLNVSFQQIQKYEKGSNGLNCFLLGQLAEFFKIPISYFYEGFNFRTYESDIQYTDKLPEININNQIRNEKLYPNPNSFDQLPDQSNDTMKIVSKLTQR